MNQARSAPPRALEAGMPPSSNGRLDRLMASPQRLSPAATANPAVGEAPGLGVPLHRLQARIQAAADAAVRERRATSRYRPRWLTGTAIAVVLASIAFRSDLRDIYLDAYPHDTFKQDALRTCIMANPSFIRFLPWDREACYGRLQHRLDEPRDIAAATPAAVPADTPSAPSVAETDPVRGFSVAGQTSGPGAPAITPGPARPGVAARVADFVVALAESFRSGSPAEADRPSEAMPPRAAGHAAETPRSIATPGLERTFAEPGPPTTSAPGFGPTVEIAAAAPIATRGLQPIDPDIAPVPFASKPVASEASFGGAVQREPVRPAEHPQANLPPLLPAPSWTTPSISPLPVAHVVSEAGSGAVPGEGISISRRRSRPAPTHLADIGSERPVRDEGAGNGAVGSAPAAAPSRPTTSKVHATRPAPAKRVFLSRPARDGSTGVAAQPLPEPRIVLVEPPIDRRSGPAPLLPYGMSSGAPSSRGSSYGDAAPLRPYSGAGSFAAPNNPGTAFNPGATRAGAAGGNPAPLLPDTHWREISQRSRASLASALPN